jgi:DNA-binding transcriptional ArsR family regulator
MLRLTLTPADLDRVRVGDRPLPLVELHALLRAQGRPRWPTAGEVGAEDLGLVRDLVGPPCAPGFLFPAVSAADEALDAVAGARRDVVRRDLEDNVAAGYPLPRWTDDLVSPGAAGTAARHRLRAALGRVVARIVEPRTADLAPLIAGRAAGWRRVGESRDATAMLDAMHPTVRCRDSVLEVDLASGADVEAVATGAGLRIVPTLSGTPSVTVSAQGDAPTVLAVPLGPPAPEDTGYGRPALDDLLGPSRALLLAVVGRHPGLGTRELARRTGLAPASVSDHAGVLRRAGLVRTARAGRRVAHDATPLGRALLAGPASSI